jgi:arylsulfatase A-like enzyme
VPVCSVDFFPTLLEAADAAAPAGSRIDGVSLRPVFAGGALPQRSLFWHYPHYGNQGGAPAAAIRKGNHKLIRWFEEDRVELFDLSADLSERNDLAPARPDLVDALGAELKTWQEEVGAKFPAPNPDYDSAKPSGRAAARKQGAPAPVKSKK